MKKIIFFFLILFSLSGCSYKELNDLAIASALGIDYENGIYTISAQILNLKKSGSEDTNTSTLLYEASGPTIAEAIRNIGLKYPNTLYLGHLELVIIGKGEIEHGINHSFDYFIRTSETRNDAILLISTENTAKEILNPNDEKEEEFPAKDILTTIENSMKRNGKVVNKNFEEFTSNYLEPGMVQTVTSIKNEKNPNKDYKNSVLEGIAIFNKEKYIGLLSENSAVAYNILNENFYDIDITVPYKEEYISVAAFDPKSSVELKIKDNKIIANIAIRIDGHILEYEENRNLTEKKILTEVEAAINKELKKYVEELIKFCKENNTDVIGLKNIIYKKYYKQYDKYKDKNIYELAEIKLDIKSNVFRYGNVHKGFSGGNNE